MGELAKSPASFFGEFRDATRDEAAAIFDFLVELARDFLTMRAARNLAFTIHGRLLEPFWTMVRQRDIEGLDEFLWAMVEARNSLDDYANRKLALTHAEIQWERFLDQ